ncbi:MAG TPA: Trm112 family protein [Isosphaeraceae bacterium]|nr:Trm112 family protein [Isosphaeraceae bacterium]
MVSEDLLALLVCPMGKAPLRRDGDYLVCTRCGPRFAIRDDIPNMLIEEAELPPGCPSIADLECVKSGQVEIDVH